MSDPVAQRRRPGASQTKQSIDPSLDDIILVDQLDSKKWPEGLSIRPNQHAIATSVFTNNLYAIDLRHSSPDTDDSPNVSPPKVIASFSGVNSVFNCCRLKGTKNEDYAVGIAYVDFAAKDIHGAAIWRVSIDPDDEDAPPTKSQIAQLPDNTFPFGMIPISDDYLAIADPVKWLIWRVHIPTGKISTLLDDPETMKPATEEEMFGVNRILIQGGFLWYGNTSRGALYRAPIEFTDSGRDIRITGPSKVVADGFQFTDGIALRKDLSAAYISSYVLGKVWRIDINQSTGEGISTLILDELMSPTALELVYYEEDEKPTLYIACGGAFHPDQLSGDAGAWLPLAGLDISEVRVEVTVETTVTYEPVDDEK